jgi:hypothetical protein
MLSRLSQGELLVGAGALVLVLGELLFGVVTRDYSLGQLPWAIAAIALIIVALRAAGRSFPAHDTILILAGFAMAVVGVRDLLYDVRTLAGESTTWYLGFLAYYVGVALMAAGAWMIWRKKPA